MPTVPVPAARDQARVDAEQLYENALDRHAPASELRRLADELDATDT